MCKNKKIEVTGFEPATSASRTQRSTKLSHTSMFVHMKLKKFENKKVEVTGFEPATSASRTQRSTKLSHTSIFVLLRLTTKIIIYRWGRFVNTFFAKNEFLWKGTNP